MPGHMLIAKCPCGFLGGADPGVSELDMKLQIIAYDPVIGTLVTIPEDEATQRGLTVYPDPYAYDLKHFLDGDISATPKRDSALFLCPKCEQLTMRFYLGGLWD